jgi:glycosyltransferase involved in cell wall biosynthesis
MGKKILCLIDSLESGGAERQMSYLCVGLKNKGYDVKLVVFSAGKGFYEDYVIDNGVNVSHNLKGINRYRRIIEIVKLVKSLKPDAVIAYKDGVTIASCLARLLCCFYLIVSERNTTQNLSKYERLKFFCYRFANKIVPNSFSQQTFIEKNYPHLAKKTIVITNTIDTQKFHPTGHDVKEDLTIVTTARIMPQKNVLKYLEALSIVQCELSNVKFVWYGNQDSYYFKDVITYVKEHKLSNLITFYPATKDVIKIYHSADIYCLPSIYEGFPNVVCEAMACGLPIICSNVCDNPNIVENGVNGYLFNPNDSSDIAKTIKRMIDLSQEERHNMGANNVQKIYNLCSSEKFITSYSSLFTNDEK